MNFLKKLPLNNRLTSFFLGIALITVVAFNEFLYLQFETGLEDSTKLRLLTEFNAFSQAYEKDSSTPLPASYVISFHYDKLPKYDVRGVNFFEKVILKNGEFVFIFGDEVHPNPSDYDPLLIVYRQELYDGRIVYAVAKYEIGMTGNIVDQWFDDQLKFTWQIIFGYLVFTFLALWFYNYRVGKKTEQLVNWAERISNNFSDQITPNFKFDEFNRVASCLKTSLRKNASLVEREKKFLSHASHELRTPIAIIKANMEILEKMDISDMAQVPLARVERASTNMQLITETLLWLARQSDEQPSKSLVSMSNLLHQLVEEQHYLIQGEDVEVIHDYMNAPELVLPSTPVMIVLNNLIRNAFQYTHRGWIKISYLNHSIVIENSDCDDMNENNTVSFGLGLELTEKMCKKLDWRLDIRHQQGGVLAILTLPISEHTDITDVL